MATCDQPNAPRASHAILRDQRSARRYPAAPIKATVVQAIEPAKGIDTAISEVDISIASDSPPTVAATRESRSTRQNPYRPRPASRGFTTMKARIAAAGESVENSAIGVR